MSSDYSMQEGEIGSRWTEDGGRPCWSMEAQMRGGRALSRDSWGVKKTQRER